MSTDKMMVGRLRAAARAAGVAALLLTTAAGPARAHLAAPDSPKRVLFLNAYGYGRSGVDSFIATYTAALNAAGVSSEDIMVEYLNLNRDDGPEARARARQLLLLRYKIRKPDLIVAVQTPALSYLLGELGELGRSAPLLAITAGGAAPAPGAGMHLWRQRADADFAGTLRQAVALFPATRTVVVALGAAPADQLMKRSMEAAAAPWAGRLRFDYLDGLSLAQMRARVAALGPHSILLCATVNRDKDGAQATPLQFGAELARLANAPAFGLYNTLVGEGVVGGSVLHLEREAQRLAATSLSLMQGGEGAAPAPPRHVALYDWRQLERWGGDAAALPADAEFIHRPASLWQQQRAAVLAALAVFAALTALLSALLLQRRRLRQAQAASRDSGERYRLLVEHAPEAILVYDVDQLRFVDANGNAERLLGCARAALLALGPLDLYTEAQSDGLPLAASVAEHVRRALAGERIVTERLVRRRDGSVFPCDVWLVRLPTSGRRLLRGGFIDISERKRGERELQQHRDHLGDLVQQRTAALSVALAEAEAANRAKNIFLANMSHELRTPLNAVIGFSQLMGDAAALPAEARHNLAIINRAGHHLLTLINDILELSKIEAGRMELQPAPLDLRALLGEVLDMVRPRGAGLALRLDCGALPASLLLDGGKLRQVLLNLLSNAVKFVARGGVTLALRSAALPDGRLALDFSVSDTGIGIAAADQERIFEPFVQADTPALRAGTGLGLTLARQFVRLMGGELSVESTPGVGSEFRFTLHAEVLAGAAAAPGEGPVRGLAPGQGGRRVLVVDDDADCRALLRALLEPLGFRVSVASDGAAALASLARQPAELLLCDRRMPGLDGVALTRRLRAGDAAARPRIVIMTAAAFAGEEAEALAAGADAFLRKPIERDKLFALIERLLGLEMLRGAPPGADAG
ncbi:ATP-binding protein, partial [Janthinobacterium sp.]|uniref:ATP-binding protein n=1 Tax=Janthinobacterium sp. TaxID=1871054 RepID=UPI00293D6CD3